MTVMLEADVGMMWRIGNPAGLWMVSVCKSRDFLMGRKSRSLPIEFVGEFSGDLGGVVLVLDPLPRFASNEGDKDGTYGICEVEGRPSIGWSGRMSRWGGVATGVDFWG